MKHHPHQVKETVRDSAAADLALRCLETAASRWTDDIDRELEDKLAECDWTDPHLVALARRIIREANETAS